MQRTELEREQFVVSYPVLVSWVHGNYFASNGTTLSARPSIALAWAALSAAVLPTSTASPTWRSKARMVPVRRSWTFASTIARQETRSPRRGPTLDRKSVVQGKRGDLRAGLPSE